MHMCNTSMCVCMYSHVSIWFCRLDRFQTAFELASVVVRWSRSQVNDLIRKHVHHSYIYHAVGGANCLSVMEAFCFQIAVDHGLTTLPTFSAAEHAALDEWRESWLKGWPRAKPYTGCECKQCKVSN